MKRRRTKAGRRESFRCHAQGYPTRTPGWARINARVTLGPAAWTRFCELLIDDTETTHSALMEAPWD